MNNLPEKSFKKKTAIFLAGIAMGFGISKIIQYIQKKYPQSKNDYQSQKRLLGIIEPDQQPNTKEKVDIHSKDYQETVEEQLARTGQYFGQEGLENIKSSNIIIVGVGGVGSHAAAQLIRAGVGRIKVIDFDLVTLSSLNRHSFALRQDVGISKVKCIQNYAKKLFSHVEVHAIDKMFSKKNADELLTFGNDENGNPIKIGRFLNKFL